MKIVIISSCTGRKQYKPKKQLSQNDFKCPKILTAKSKNLSKYECIAEQMYTGEQHIRLMEGIKILRDKQFNLDLYVLSAGYGLISGNKKIVPYECTFDTMKAKEIDEWAKFLSIPCNFRRVIEEYDLAFVLLGKKYMRSLQIKDNEKFLTPLIFFSSQKEISTKSNIAIYPTGIKETKIFHCGLVGLKGEIFKTFAEQVTNVQVLELQNNPKTITKILNNFIKRRKAKYMK